MKIISKGHFKNIKQFHIFQQKKLGNGAFGVVKLAIHAATNKYYAIKIISLKDIPSQHELKLIQRQIKLHSQISHPHVITLWDTIVDQKNLYMILDYAEKGNLFYYQNTKNKFSQPQAFIYFSQAVKAVQNLHSNNIMHRDIKPQNLLIDQYFNIKLCDFGWSAQNINTKRATFCGTYEYMAPQMIFNSHYDYRVDIWALGILLYEMIHGYAPFKGNNASQVKEKMLKSSYHLSQKLSQTLKSLIVSLLKFDPNQRLSIKQILNHPWFQRMQVLVSSYLIGQKVYDPLLVHKYICDMPFEVYNSSQQSDIYSHTKQYEDCSEKKKYASSSNNTNSTNHTTTAINNIRPKLNQYDSLDKDAKSININFSINNFSYLKDLKDPNNNTQSQVKKYLSPSSNDLRKKKSSSKRIKTQANADNMTSVLSSSKIGVSRSKEGTKKQDKKTPSKSNLKVSKNRKTSNQFKGQKSSHKPSLQTQETSHPSSSTYHNSNPSHQSSVMQRIAMNLKRHAIKQKSVSNHQQYSPRNNIRGIRKIKSKDKSSFADFSHM